ncbi:MAG: hypothetical protein WCF19_00335 [Chlamydiales bacterium]
MNSKKLSLPKVQKVQINGEVLGIKDVVTFQGTTVDEIEKVFKDSIDDYLAFCAERGEEPDRPFSEKVQSTYTT